jgi:membrane fusion protein (multidrug efflux system)
MTAQEQFSNAIRAARARLTVIAAVVLAIVLIAAVWIWLEAGHESTDDAQVDGRITPIAARVGGIVETVAIDDNQRVKKGEVLVRLDQRPYQAAVDHAAAELADAEAASRAAETGVPIASTTTSSDVTTAQAGVDVARATETAAAADVEASRAQLAAARARLAERETEAARSKRDFERLADLMKKDEVSRQQYDTAEAAAKAADAAAAAAAADVKAAESGVRLAESRLVQAHGAVARAEAQLASARTAPEQMKVTKAQAEGAAARVERARAALRQAQLNLEYTTLAAPADGVVSKKQVEVGQVVQPGQAVMALVSVDDVWITANFKETQLDGMRPGQRAVVSVDAYGGHTFKGHVDSIAPATGARFSLLPPENATGNYVKVVQRVPVKILIERGEDPDRILRPGMSVVPTVYTR